MMETLNYILKQFTDVRVLLLGDIMLDKYIHGSIKRISPEAPVPILQHNKEEMMLGGVGNVFRNLIALSSRQHSLLSVAGKDGSRILLENLLANTAKYHLFTDPGRKTTQKVRLIAQGQQIVRYDEESTMPLTIDLQDEILEKYGEELKHHDILVLSDYDKGFFSKEFTLRIIQLAKKADALVIVDPKSRDFSVYAGADFVKPNRKELSEASGLPVQTIDEVVKAARFLCDRHKINNIIVTLGEEGMLYVPSSGCGDNIIHSKIKHTPEIFDVSGAGDTVLAVLALALGCKIQITQALDIANAAAQIVIGKSGTAIVSPKEILCYYTHNYNQRMPNDDPFDKIVDLHKAREIVRIWKNKDEIVCFTNGCFDLLHFGHISSFLQAKKYGDRLIVALNSDISVKKNKGEHRPIQDEKTRAALLAVLQCVDMVIMFDDDTALRLVQELHPDVITKEGYSMESWPEARFVQTYGGNVVFLEKEIGYSTSVLIEKMAECEAYAI